MKTTILLMFSLFFITGSLPGQKDKFDYIDSDIKKLIVPVLNPISPQLKKPDFNLPGKFDWPTMRNPDRFILYKDSTFINCDTVRLFSDFVVVEEFPGASRFYGYPFVKIPDTNGKLIIKKPDMTSKYYLIIKDPLRNTITK
jgi:hypothetical protein